MLHPDQMEDFFWSPTVHDISFMNKIITSYMNLNWFITQISMTLQAAFHAFAILRCQLKPSEANWVYANDFGTGYMYNI